MISAPPSFPVLAPSLALLRVKNFLAAEALVRMAQR